MRSFVPDEVLRHIPALRAASNVAVESLEGRRLLSGTIDYVDEPYSYGNPSIDEMQSEVMAARGGMVLIGRPNAAKGSIAQAGMVTLINTTPGAMDPVSTIENPNAQVADYFGSAVAFISDNLVAVTSFENASGIPTVFLFTIGSDGEGAPAGTIQAPAGWVQWGNTLAAINGTLLVSDPSGGPGGGGAVYRYDAVGGATPIATYSAANALNADYTRPVQFFGQAMAVDDVTDTMLFSMQDTANDARRVVEMNLAGTVVRNYFEGTSETGPENTGPSFSVGFAGDTVVVGDVNADRVSQFSRVVPTGGSTGELLREIPGNGVGLGMAITTGADTFTVADSFGTVHIYATATGTERDYAQEGSPRFGAYIGSLSGNRIAITDPLGSDFKGGGQLYVFDLDEIGDSGPTATLSGGNVVVAGTGEVDAITVRIVNGLLQVFSGTDVIGSFSVGDVTGVSITGGAGDDTITSDSTNTFPTVIRGGDGNDTVRGGGGNDFLFGDGGNDALSASQGNDVAVGGDGNDRVRGGTGRDVLIGGDGADDVEGNSADDILVAGSTSYDGDATTDRLATVRDRWLSPDVYADRIAEVEMLSDFCVLRDEDTDTVQGGSGMDWFLVEDEDVLKDLKRTETVNEVV